jgi:hypothetical protein
MLKRFAYILSCGAIFSSLFCESSVALPRMGRGGDAFSVQVLLSDKQLQPADAKFKGVKDINEEVFDGKFKYKYTTGKTTTFAQAAETRLKMIDEGFKDAFVVVYKDGQRLMSKVATAAKKEKPISQPVAEKPKPAEKKTKVESKPAVAKTGFGSSVVEKAPEFPGGYDSMVSFMKNNLHDQQENIKDGEWKREYVGFLVDRNGKLQNVKMLTSINPKLDSEALRLVHAMPDWKPGTIDSAASNKEYVLPLDFFVSNKE